MVKKEENTLDNLAIKHLQDLYGLNPNIPTFGTSIS